jgi:hypothetical protein
VLTYTKLSPLYNYTIHVRKDTRASPVLGGHVDKAILQHPLQSLTANKGASSPSQLGGSVDNIPFV